MEGIINSAPGTGLHDLQGDTAATKADWEVGEGLTKPSKQPAAWKELSMV